MCPYKRAAKCCAMKDELRDSLLSAGASLVGYADMGPVPPEARENLPFAVSIAVALDPHTVAEIRTGPTSEYWAEYRRVNRRLADLADLAAGSLISSGHVARALVPTIAETDPVTHAGVSYDPQTLSVKLPHKTAATLAGLGWIGKSDLLVTREYGSAVRLTTVLTDAPLRPGRPVRVSSCGSCHDCFDACPAHAIAGNLWRAGASRETLVDAFSCRRTAHALAKERAGIDETICGICISACHRTQRYIMRAQRRTDRRKSR